MATNLFYLPYRPAYDAAGISVPGAQVYFTEAGGTNTPLAVYSDEALTVELSNPVVADGAGKFPTVYLQEDQYRVRVYGRNAEVGVDTPLEEYDPYIPGALIGFIMGSETTIAANRTEMAGYVAAGPTSGVYLAEAGREGLFIWNSSNLSTLVAADTAQGVYVPPTSAPTGASGAWVRKFDGPVYANWFGAVSGASAAVNGPAFLAAIAYLKATASNDDGAYKGSVPLMIKPGDYNLGANTLDITHQVRIEAEGGTANAGKAVILRWSANTTGIRIQYTITSGAGTVDGAPHYSGASSHFKGLQMVGGYTNFASEGEYHGFHCKVAVVIEDCYINNFQGDGIYVNAVAGGGAPNEGNANVMHVLRTRVDNCRNGVYMNNSDANAGVFIALNLNANRQWGVWDSSFLGNTYVACHAAGNGQSASGMTPTMVSHGGNRYSPVFGQEAGAATNAPTGTATDNTWWYYYAPGGAAADRSIPAWSNGMTLRSGGSYMMEQAANVMLGCYGEADQGNTQVQTGSICIGGIQGTAVHGLGTYIRSALNYTTVDKLRVALDSGFVGQVTMGGEVHFIPTTLYNGKIFSNDGARSLNIDGQNFISITIGGGFTANWQASGLDLATGKVISVNGDTVVKGRLAAVADAAALTSVDGTNAAAAPTQAEFNALVAEFNKLRTDVAAVRTPLNSWLARARAATGHGLIA